MMNVTWKCIPGQFDFDDIYQEMVDRAPVQGAHFVEIGVLFGRSTLFLAEAIRRSGKQIRFDAVDRAIWDAKSLLATFDRYLEQQVPVSDRLPGLRQILEETPSIGEIVPRFLAMAGLSEYANFVIATGQARAETYFDRSLDFVFIDTEHTYKDTTELLSLYVPKLKPNGFLAGHDHTDHCPEVARAVKDVLGQAPMIRRSSFLCDMSTFREAKAAGKDNG